MQIKLHPGQEECTIRSQTMPQWSVPLFLGLEGALYLAFLFQSLVSPGGGVLVQYTGMALCLVLALWFSARGGDSLAALGLALALAADTVFLLPDRWRLAGILLLYGEQVAYLVRILKANGGRALLLGRMALFAALMALLLRAEAFHSLTAAAALYLSHFFFNLAQSLHLRGRGGALFFWGLFLYFCCAIWAGLCNAPGLLSAPLCEYARTGVWLLYLPGQALIALSGYTPLQGEVNHGQTK